MGHFRNLSADHDAALFSSVLGCAGFYGAYSITEAKGSGCAPIIYAGGRTQLFAYRGATHREPNWLPDGLHLGTEHSVFLLSGYHLPFFARITSHDHASSIIHYHEKESCNIILVATKI
jgi:hypothetical protein